MDDEAGLVLGDAVVASAGDDQAAAGAGVAEVPLELGPELFERRQWAAAGVKGEAVLEHD